MPRKTPVPVCLISDTLPCTGLARDHLAAERLPDRLMTEANAQDRNVRCGLVDEVETNAGFGRRAGARRKHDRIRPHCQNVGDRNLVIAMHGDISPQPAQVMERG